MAYPRIANICTGFLLLCLWAGVPVCHAAVLDDILPDVERRVADPCVAWPLDWQRGYVDTIQEALRCHHDRSDYRARIEVFRQGFPRYWNGSHVTGLTQAGYEMLRAEIRWYCETLMAEELPTDSEKSVLKSQVQDLCNSAAEHLSGQFPFLAERCLREGTQSALRELDEKLLAPLLPIYRKPLTQGQLEVIQTHWASLYSRWFSLWRQVRFETMLEADGCEPNAIACRCQCEFVRRCLGYLPRTIWSASETPPGYVLDALQKLNIERTANVRRYEQTRRREIDLALHSRNQVEQIEQWGFIFTALLEMGMPDEDRGLRQPVAEKEVMHMD